MKITATPGVNADGIEIYHLSIAFYKTCDKCHQKNLDKKVWATFPVDSTPAQTAIVLNALRKKLTATLRKKG